MAEIQSFSPEVGTHPRVLVLGSIPGVASLRAVQYYAHPRNAFWPIMAELFSFDNNLPYEARLNELKRQGIALWDVLQRCERVGSLDSAIQKKTIQVNPIDTWLDQHSSVQLVLLNGGTAAQEFRKHFSAFKSVTSVTIETMPSTSPAYAAMAMEEKMQRWHEAIRRVKTNLG